MLICILIIVILLLNHIFNLDVMKLTINQFNCKRNYYKVWFPLMKSLRFHSRSWYLLECLHFEDRFRSTLIVDSFKDLVLADFHDMYFKRIDNYTYHNEYRNCLNFLLSCNSHMTNVFAKDVVSLYPEIYESVEEVLREITDVTYPFLCK